MINYCRNYQSRDQEIRTLSQHAGQLQTILRLVFLH